MAGFRTQYLTPIKKPPVNEPYGVLDIEGRKWINFICAGTYDGAFFQVHHDLDALFEYLENHATRVWFAHFGGIYDFLFLLRYVVLSRGRFILESIIPRGSGILCFDLICVRTGGRITFRDSGALLPMGLARLTKSFGVAHEKKKFNVAKITKATPELIEYLKHDCIGLFEVLEKYYANPLIEKSGPKYTVASQSLQIFRSFLTDKIPACPPSVDRFVRRAYAGGRVEIFKPFFKTKSERKLRCYDVNSLYPSIMRDFDVPGEFEELTAGQPVEVDRMGFADCSVFVPKSIDLPLLWKRTDAGKFIFPTGSFRGVYSTLELRRAVELGAKITRTHGAAYFRPLGGLFRKFVETLYEIRENTTDEVLKTIIKLTLNALYGRCGMNLLREGLTWDEGQAGVKPYMEMPLENGKAMRFGTIATELRSWTHVGIAAWITAGARVRMHEHLSACGSELYYTDTDSLYTTKEFPTSKKLGELKAEPFNCRTPKRCDTRGHRPGCYVSSDACFLLPKTYIAGEKLVMKGFDSRKIKHFKLQDFEAALEGDLRTMKCTVPAKMARLKTALRHGEFLYLTKKGEKRIKSRYDKRIVFRRGKRWDSRPIELREN